MKYVGLGALVGVSVYVGARALGTTPPVAVCMALAGVVLTSVAVWLVS